MSDFYEGILDTITLGAYDRLKKRVHKVESIIGSVLVTKEDLERKLTDVKTTIKREVDEKVMKLASIDSMLSLAQGLNKRMDNILDSVTALKKQQDNMNPAGNADLINNLVNQVTTNTTDITKNQSDVLDLKQILAQIVPQVVQSIDPATLSSLVESIVTKEIAALTSTEADTGTTNTQTTNDTTNG